MGSGTYEHSCRVQVYIFKPTSSTLFKSPSPFGGIEKLDGTQTLSSSLSNVLVATIAGFGAPSRVYSNKKIQTII